MIVKVEQRHIDQGIREHCTRCPIALAIMDAVGHSFVRVESEECNIRDGWYDLPDHVCTWICNFDDGEPDGPFEFHLAI